MKITHKKILSVAKNFDEFTIKDLIDETGMARRTLFDNLKELVNIGEIEAIGEGRNRYYKKIPKLEENYKEISVFKEATRLGTLKCLKGSYIFSYDSHIKQSDYIDSLPDNSSSMDLFAEFENLLPESDRRKRLLEEYKVDDEADLLIYLKNAHGSYDFIPLHEEAKYIEDYSKRPTWISVKNKILGENEYPNILVDYEIDIEDDILDVKSDKEHSDLSGYQNKIDISIDEETKRIYEDKKYAEFLLKPYNEDLSNYFKSHKQQDVVYFPYLAVNEHLFMTFAKNELLFDIPYTGIIKGKSDFHYITKRYDRYDNYKYHQKDFAQCLGLKSEHKYSVTSEKLFESINNMLFSNDEKLNALSFYYYSSIIKHEDLHAKNMGILNIGKNKYKLAPFYDLISVGIYNYSCDCIGLPITNLRKKTKLKISDFYGLAEILGIPKELFKKEAKRITEIFLDKFPEYIENTKELLKYDSLDVYKTRLRKSNFIIRLAGFYNERVKEFKKTGILNELGIENKYLYKLKEENILKYDKRILSKLHEKLKEEFKAKLLDKNISDEELGKKYRELH